MRSQLCSPGWPGTVCIHRPGWSQTHRSPTASTSQSSGIKCMMSLRASVHECASKGGVVGECATESLTPRCCVGSVIKDSLPSLCTSASPTPRWAVLLSWLDFLRLLMFKVQSPLCLDFKSHSFYFYSGKFEEPWPSLSTSSRWFLETSWQLQTWFQFLTDF